MNRARFVPFAMLAIASIATCGCRGPSVREGRAATQAVPSVGPSPRRIANAAPLGAAAAADAGATSIDDGMPRLTVVLDDPRLSAARERDTEHDPSGAARAVEAAMATANLSPVEVRAWSYVAGRLHLQASESTEAAAAFDRALAVVDPTGAPWVLASYAALRDAQALVRGSHGEAAVARALSIGDDIAAHDEARLALADAYVVKGDRAQAVPLWRAALAAAPHGVRWADTSIQLATALLDGVDGPPADHATEALELMTRVLVESPMAADSVDVIDMRTRAARLLRMPGAPLLTPAERARQAQAYLDVLKPKRASEVAEALLKAIPARGKVDADTRAAACKAALVRAHAVPHGKADTADEAWTVAIDRCRGDESEVTALYYGAKAATAAHHDDEALERYARVEKQFPTHRLADDARMRAAQIAMGHGDTARYVSLMQSVPDAYPDGDMKSEALFRFAFEKIEARELDPARAALDRLMALPSEDRSAGSAGRAAYFRARVSQLAGDVDDAKARYAALVGTQPLSFYMLLATERLRDLDPETAHTLLEQGPAREGSGPLLTSPHPELSSAAFDRFQRLLEVGEIDAARHEASAGGLLAEGVDAEVLWTLAWSYDRAGAPDLGHSFARGRLSEFRAHWPAGRWRLPWQIAYPRAWPDLVATESSAAGIPAPLTWSIMREESAFNPEAKSSANAIGLMQLLVGTGRQVARGTTIVVDEDSLHRPDVSITLGARMLASMRGSFAYNPALAIAAYNSGSAPVRRWLNERGGDDFDVFVERIPFDETRNYIKRVLTSEAAYAYLYAPDTMTELLSLPQRASGQQAIAGP